MTDHADQLRETFETHERLAPDPAAVYARVQDLARTYQRRRRGAQVAGGAVLGAGLIAGGLNIPALLSNNASPSNISAGALPATVTTTPPIVAPTRTTAPTQAELQADWDAYFQAGYGYDDAVKLAKIWHSRDEVGLVKAEAGRRLLAGERLPITPHPNSTANPGGGDTGSPITAKDQKRIDAFFAAGYDYNDAVKLAKQWHQADPYQAKIEGGKRLLAGGTLPIQP
jgi:hypothetical protein